MAWLADLGSIKQTHVQCISIAGAKLALHTPYRSRIWWEQRYHTAVCAPSCVFCTSKQGRSSATAPHSPALPDKRRQLSNGKLVPFHDGGIGPASPLLCSCKDVRVDAALIVATQSGRASVRPALPACNVVRGRCSKPACACNRYMVVYMWL